MINDDIGRIFATQRETALRWRTSTAKERVARIRKLHDAVMDSRQMIRDAGFRDFRKPAEEVDLTELVPVISEARDAMRCLARWIKPKHVMPTRLMLGTRSWIKYEPRGRCLIVSPWNYPFFLTLAPLVSCLAAGNTAIIKPSELSPHLSAVIAGIVRDTFAENEVALFEGDAGLATRLLELPFDHIFFTGSPAVGKIVMAAAAKNLASVTLELGGKSPAIVDADADVAAAARTTMWGKFTNNGQTCIAPDHAYVHASIKTAFVAECVSILQTTFGATATDQKSSPMLARVVNSRHAQRVADLLDDAKASGSRLLYGGETSIEENFIQPTLLDAPTGDSRIMTEEIFGPLLPIIEFDDLRGVIDRINDQPKPLALYYWGRSSTRINQVLGNTSSGGSCINNCLVQFLHGRLPVGGINQSGIGSSRGQFGFKAFSHERAVVRSYIPITRIFFPPYTKMTRRLLDTLLRML